MHLLFQVMHVQCTALPFDFFVHRVGIQKCVQRKKIGAMPGEEYGSDMYDLMIEIQEFILRIPPHGFHGLHLL